jgi:uncharacterized protein (DUF362 family)
MNHPQRLSRRAFLHALGATAAAAVASQACRAFGMEPLPTLLVPPTPNGEVPAAMPTDTLAPSLAPSPAPSPTPPSLVGRVAFVKTDDRADGVQRALDLLGIRPAQGRRVFLKPNYNTADPAPSSTHPEVLRSLAEWLRATGAETITIGDRSGMGDTRTVMDRAGAFEVASDLGLETVVFDELNPEGWAPQQPPGSHWSRGFALARPVAEAEAVVLACCLKTHRFGGHFTLSLKNAVGMVAKRVPGEGYDYMTELHNSAHQRRMIAEINTAYTPALAVIDGVDAFTTGGPEAGTLVHAQVVLAGADRIALDAVGVALLRYFGTTNAVASGPIFQQDQISRAVELGLGVTSADGIHLVTDDPESAAYAASIQPILLGA